MKGSDVKRILLIVAGMIFGAGLALGVPAMANTYPTPTGTPTVGFPTATPTVIPTVPPVVNPFARCSFSFSFSSTFDPRRGRFIRRIVPAIVCDGRFGGVSVYDLVR
jgi:hypothetical protein